MNKKLLSIEAKVENLGKVTEFVEGSLDEFGCSMKSKMQIDVAIDEIFSNIAYYAYSPEVGTAEIEITVSDSQEYVEIVFSDGGVPFNPLEQTSQDTSLSAEERNFGGLGIHMVKKTMDDVNYEYCDGKNILKIKKNL